MQVDWDQIAARAVRGLGAQAGELVLLRVRVDRAEAFHATLLALERVGAVPLIEYLPDDYLLRLLHEVDPLLLEHWDRHRLAWMQRIDRILVLADESFEGDVPPAASRAWWQATARLTAAEEARKVPFLLAAIPSARRAAQLGLAPEELDRRVLPALVTPEEELRAHISRARERAGSSGAMITVRTGEQCELRLRQGARLWLCDDGLIDAEDRRSGAIASNLPAGSMYTTVLEDSVDGSIRVPAGPGGSELELRFARGAIVAAEPIEQAGRFLAMLDRHSGGARRVSHLGLGLNPLLHGPPIGWPLVDEHILGGVFLALGENRYMGGQNESSLNVDYAVAGATVLVNGRVLIAGGEFVPEQGRPGIDSMGERHDL
ncbi:MAG: leucyl aminopeptidase [Candidatus Schekmanbacteria bacterium]|nr:leucyl aminopeptidase [Candidatus Schekmanbacteria bacterium]